MVEAVELDEGVPARPAVGLVRAQTDGGRVHVFEMCSQVRFGRAERQVSDEDNELIL
jgi:hypothetical protein